jgi:uncharacterized secreted repeat protein (TIGR03808 family)
MRVMTITRRRLLAGSLSGAAAFAVPAIAAPLSTRGLDAAQFGVRPGASDDQTVKLQRAIGQAARARVPLSLAPGRYRAGDLKLPAGAQLIGVRGATHIKLTSGPSLISSEHADSVTLSGLTLDGGGQPLPARRGLVHLIDMRGLRIEDCDILHAGGDGISLTQSDGQVTRVSISDAANTGLFSLDGRGMIISVNIVRGCGNGGIAVWQSEKRHDGTLIADNTIEDIAGRAGGTGQNGNAIAVFRAGDVIVRGNHIRNARFSAIRGNSAANIQIIGNSCLACDDVALYSEFDFEGCIMADNAVDGAGSGISVTNFDFKHGRLASVRGNLLRNLKARAASAPPQDFGLGLHIEGDTAVTGNVIEGAALAAMRAGWGPYLRNVAITGNVMRQCAVGVEVSVVKGTGQALIAGNVFDAVPGGAVVGMEWRKKVTGDLTKEGAARYPQLTIANNRVS